MKILNLYAGLGGNRKDWAQDHEVTAVEMDMDISRAYKNQFANDRVIVADAHQFLINHYKEYDFIWSSPPCPTHSKMMKATKHKKKKYPDMSLYHCFWSNFDIPDFDIPDFDIPNHKNFIRADSPEEIESMKEWLGIQYKGNIYYKKNHSPGQVLRNCVHPSVGNHILMSIVKL